MISKTYTLYIIVIYVYVEISTTIYQHIHTHTQDGWGCVQHDSGGSVPSETEAKGEPVVLVLTLSTCLDNPRVPTSPY